MFWKRKAPKPPFYGRQALTELLGRAHAGDRAARMEIERIARPCAVDRDFTALLLVQPKHARRIAGGKLSWLSCAPMTAESIQVADCVRLAGRSDEAGFSFPIPRDFPVDDVVCDAAGAFSLCSGAQRITGTLKQLQAATCDVEREHLVGASEAGISRAFRSIPTTPEPVARMRKTATDCPPVHDPVLGTVVFNPQGQWWEAGTRCAGRSIAVTLFVNEPDALAAALSTARRVVEGFAAFDATARHFAAERLLTLHNEAWKEDPEPAFTAEAFAGRLAPESIAVTATGDWSIGYDDGELFAGHEINVEFDVRDEPTAAGF